ncbi:DUF3347 domain-containing protein [Aquimarina sp. U1-2]|uniref:DUF3347 domain-containing protein n=1 Tax=Aquimarina sp. U1-2 TaxID=2823141 RepID=UPI001AEC7C4C|nr:DUF3347 domain-containing protein [Aquimarina sp. U1-2]MBP2831687.1 DUF3347 domain-containing protein [Aquimarina sp. U1-2]
MKKSRILVMLFLLITALSCKKDSKSEKTISETGDLNQTESRTEVKFSEENVQAIYENYLAIKAGLVNADLVEVRNLSKKFEAILQDSEEHKQLKATLKLISLTKDIQKQRDFFVTITNEVTRIITNAQIISGAVYKQYCPMALEGSGGYWLSDSEEVRNPYFGSKMLKCGSVKQTIQ